MVFPGLWRGQLEVGEEEEPAGHTWVHGEVGDGHQVCVEGQSVREGQSPGTGEERSWGYCPKSLQGLRIWELQGTHSPR